MQKTSIYLAATGKSKVYMMPEFFNLRGVPRVLLNGRLVIINLQYCLWQLAVRLLHLRRGSLPASVNFGSGGA